MKVLQKILLTIFFICSSWIISFAQDYLYPKREFRAVWIATVYNIDWPRTKDYAESTQKADFNKILDFYKDLNFNAVIAQIRMAGDVLYPSKYEPWARYLTQKEGKDPGYDPLAFMIEETHRRGLEYHAWFNPYRASMTLDSTSFDQKHAFHQHRDWLIPYGNRFYFNPGLPEVRKYVTDIIMEVVQNYDVDAIHFDDYFYPYKVKDAIFNDTLAFQKYGQDFDKIEDWRRANVDSLIKMISERIQAVKPYVKFGISPFGVWRNRANDPKGSDTKAGQTCYDDLYADPLSWDQNAWLDYIHPQLYWSIGFDPASHSTLVEWWAKNIQNTPVYIGFGAYKVDNNTDPEWAKPNQILKQITLQRLFENVHGGAFFSAKSLMNNPLNLAKLLKKEVYQYPALIPLDKKDKKYKAPTSPKLIKFKKKRKRSTLFWEITNSEQQNLRNFLIYRIPKGEPQDFEQGKYLWKKIPVQKGQIQYFQIDKTFKAYQKYTYFMSVVNRHHQESEVKGNW